MPMPLPACQRRGVHREFTAGAENRAMDALLAQDDGAPGELVVATTAPQHEAARMDAMLRGALLESRQRWRDFVTLAADLVFETDAKGNLTFLAPERILGWPAEALLHRPARELLAAGATDPFAGHTAAQGVKQGVKQGIKAWLRRADGLAACFSLNLAPLADGAGRFAGLRGTARDITAEEQAAEIQAAQLRRAATLEVLVRRLRQEVMAPRMLASTLEAMPAVLGCVGAAVLELAPGAAQVVQRHGEDPSPMQASALAMRAEGPCFGHGPESQPLALVPQPAGSAPRHALLAWRAAEARPFDAEERALLVSLADLVFVALGNQALHRELEMQARTEALTGLLNRRAFLADLRRRLERHQRETAPRPGGTLLFIDLDNFKPINDLLGHKAGDAALVAVANLLRDMVRPTDLVARLGGDEFAIWLEDADAVIAGARAESLAWAAAHSLPPLLRSGPSALTFSIGCAQWRPGSAETPEQLLARADAAMYAAKRSGRNCWRLAVEAVREAIPA
jgi:diguanylate cyclase (GGDEF)-like protein/PAS domain S-box-containing protein